MLVFHLFTSGDLLEVNASSIRFISVFCAGYVALKRFWSVNLNDLG